MFGALKTFWRAIMLFVAGAKYGEAPSWFRTLPVHAQTHLYSLALIFRLWSMPHYRNGTFQDDMVKNLRNVAIPGTGLPLSIVCLTKFSALIFVLFAYPIVAFIAAVYSWHLGTSDTIEQAFCEQLLTPNDWFSLWRLNCRLASYHAALTKAPGYRQEDKFTFLETGESLGVAVSPTMKVHSIVAKDRNEEGGMGIHFYKNAFHGGQWILQERLFNDSFVASMVPESGPLSTFRVITASRGGGLKTAGAPVVSALSCVFRAGLAGADTDHSSILFDVDLKTGLIGKGTTNAHWYKLWNLRQSWISEHHMTHHPDTGVEIAGRVVPDITAVREICTEAHLKMMPDVTMAGWDVALTTQGMCLLEANLSCNFFRGTFDKDKYFGMVHDYFLMLDHESEATFALNGLKAAEPHAHSKDGTALTNSSTTMERGSNE